MDRIRLMEKARTQDWSFTKRVLRTAYEMPNVIASYVLDDKSFQNFAYTYINVRTGIMRRIRSAVFRLAGWRI